MSDTTFGDVLRRMAPAVARIKELEDELTRLRTEAATLRARVAELEGERDDALRDYHRISANHDHMHDRAERAEAHYGDAIKDMQEWKGVAERAEADLTEARKWLAILNSSSAARTQSSDE